MITGFFGLPGCGKSTLLAKVAAKELKKIKKGKSKYKRILCNYYIKGCYKLDFRQLGVYDMSDSLILIDEITLEADSRDFKNFAFTTKQFFVLHRKYNIDVIYCTQQWDAVDRKIRELTENLYYMKRIGPFTMATAIYRKICITEEQEIKMGYVFPTFIQLVTNLSSNVIFVWRRRWYKYFYSLECPKLPEMKFEKYPD